MTSAPELWDCDGFPALDFKFRNGGRAHELLTRVVVDVSAAALDPTPVLEYHLDCVDGDLYLVVQNHGWGAAEDFSGVVNLRAFGAGVPQSAGRITAGTVEAGATCRFLLVSHRHLVPEQVPSDVILDPGWAGGPGRGVLVPPGGIQRLPGCLRYRSEDGSTASDDVHISSWRTSARWTKIFVMAGTLHAVPYPPMLSARVVEPSAGYHFMLDPEQGPRVYERSVAHVINPGEFDRIWLILAARKSGFFDFTCRFATATETVAETGPLSLHVWEPRNGIIPSDPQGALQLSNIRHPTGSLRRPTTLSRHDPHRKGPPSGR